MARPSFTPRRRTRTRPGSTDYNLYRVPVAGGTSEVPNREATRRAMARRISRPTANGWLTVPRSAPASRPTAGKSSSCPPTARGSRGASRPPSTARPTPSSGRRIADRSCSWPSTGQHLAIFRATVDDGKVETLLRGHTNGGLSLAANGRALVFTRVSMEWPTEVYGCDLSADGTASAARNLSRANQALLAQLDMPRPKSVTVKGAGGTPMQMWILKPPGFDAKKKWPLVYLVHGGPQGAWEDGWSLPLEPGAVGGPGLRRRPAQSCAAAPASARSTSTRSAATGAANAYDDLMAGVDYLEKLPYIDKDRMAAAGASFGGYMMNWFEGHTTRFKTLITHCGV